MQSPANEGTVTITVAFRAIEGVRQLPPFAGSLTVTDPPEARERIRELTAEILHQY